MQQHHLSFPFARIRSDNKGGILIFVSLAIPVLIAVVGLSVDISNYLKNVRNVQSAVDQAALSAAAVDPTVGDTREAIAERFLQTSLAELGDQITINSVNVTQNFPSGGNLSVLVTVDLSVRHSFASSLGIPATTVSLLGEASRDIENVEAVLIGAASGTMCSNKLPIANTTYVVDSEELIALSPDSNCTDFEAMRQGMRDFINIVSNNVTVSSFKVGIIPYSHKVRFPNPANTPPSVTALETSGYYQDYSSTPALQDLTTMLPLTSNMTTALNYVNTMLAPRDGMFMSRTDLPMHAAGLMLDPTKLSFFNGETPKPFTDQSTKKVVIMVTDGANLGCCFTNVSNDFSKQYVYAFTDYINEHKNICKLMKDEGVTVYSILLNVSLTQPGGKLIHDAFARCASGQYEHPAQEANPTTLLECSKKTGCFNVKTSQELVNTFTHIGNTFYKPKITQ